MPSRRLSLTAIAIGVAIVQSVLPVPALAGINNGHVPRWRVEVNQIDAGSSGIAPEFKIAIYENLLTELTKAKQFSAVLQRGWQRKRRFEPPNSEDNGRVIYSWQRDEASRHYCDRSYEVESAKPTMHKGWTTTS
jgi:hypothetical protein